MSEIPVTSGIGSGPLSNPAGAEQGAVALPFHTHRGFGVSVERVFAT